MSATLSRTESANLERRTLTLELGNDLGLRERGDCFQELSFVINDPIPGLKLVTRGDLILDFDLRAQLDRVLELLDKYRDRRMELADACLVRMSELTDACEIWTVGGTGGSADLRAAAGPPLASPILTATEGNKGNEADRKPRQPFRRLADQNRPPFHEPQEHPTSNIQWERPNWRSLDVGCWMFSFGSWSGRAHSAEHIRAMRKPRFFGTIPPILARYTRDNNPGIWHSGRANTAATA